MAVTIWYLLDHTDFGALELTLRMKDEQGKVLGDTGIDARFTNQPC